MVKKVLILGAGITGLSVAQTLSSNGIEICIIEKAERVGGIIKGFRVGQYTFDHGPHAILTRNDAAFTQFKSLVKEDLIDIGERRAGIYYEGKHYEYPLKPTAVFRHSSFPDIIKTLFSFIYYNVRRVILRPKEKSFEEYIKDYFGKELYEKFFRNYTRKVWSVEPSTLAASFAAERIPKITFSTYAKEIFHKIVPKKPASHSKNDMYYPRHGVGQIPELLEKEIKNNNGKILVNSTVQKVNAKNNKVVSVEVISDGKAKTIDCYYLVSTIPITSLVFAINPKLSKAALDSASRLKYIKIRFLFLVVNKPKVFDEHWVYFHDDKDIFNRVFDTSAFSSKLMPKGKTGLIIEITKADYSNEELFEESVKCLERYKLIKKSEIEAHYFDELEHGYPIYSVTYKKDLDAIFEELGKIKNLITAGRQGLFRYLDMDHCIRFGPAILDIIKNSKDTSTLNEIVATHGKKKY